MGNNTSSLLNLVKGHNITNSKNFGAVFKDTLDIDFIKDKETQLEKLRNKSIKVPKINKVVNTKMSNDEYLFLTKNFVNYYNENNKERMAYLKKSFSVKYLLDGETILYGIMFFCEFEDFQRNSKAQNILFLSLSEKGKTFDFPKSILYTKVIGQWGSSDILMGNENEFVKSRFIDIFKDEPIKYVFDRETIKKILGGKKYITKYYYERGLPEKKFKTIKPQYIDPKKAVSMKLGDKCINVNNGKVQIGKCGDNATKFFIQKDKKMYHKKSDSCLGFHQDGDMSLVPCDTINVCDDSNKLQSCQLFQPRKYGGLEIVGKKNKCLSKDMKAVECYKADKFSYL